MYISGPISYDKGHTWIHGCGRGDAASFHTPGKAERLLQNTIRTESVKRNKEERKKGRKNDTTEVFAICS